MELCNDKIYVFSYYRQNRIYLSCLLYTSFFTSISREEDMPLMQKKPPWKYVLTDSCQKVYVRSHPRRKEICNAASTFPASSLPEM